MARGPTSTNKPKPGGSAQPAREVVTRAGSSAATRKAPRPIPHFTTVQADPFPSSEVRFLLALLQPRDREDAKRANRFVMEAWTSAQQAKSSLGFGALTSDDRDTLTQLAKALNKAMDVIGALSLPARQAVATRIDGTRLDPSFAKVWDTTAALWHVAAALEAAATFVLEASDPRVRDDEQRARYLAESVLFAYRCAYGSDGVARPDKPLRLGPLPPVGWFIGFVAELGQRVGLDCGERIARHALKLAREHDAAT
jgi:hypothetical protein